MLDDLMLMAKNAEKFNTKDSEIAKNALCLVKIMRRSLSDHQETIGILEDAIAQR